MSGVVVDLSLVVSQRGISFENSLMFSARLVHLYSQFIKKLTFLNGYKKVYLATKKQMKVNNIF